MIKVTTLDNGLRLLTVPLPYVPSVSIGFFLGVGSRYESDDLAGASHFIEHMLFKGTARRPTALDLAEAIEGKGGIFDASTSLDTTLYWAKVAAPFWTEAVDVLSDMLLNATMDAVELDKERAVIVEEIRYSLDAPDSLAQILANQLQWPGHPLGRDVAGTVESVAALGRDALRAYLAGHYRPGSTILALAGQLEPAEAARWAEANLAAWPTGPRPAYEPAPPDHNGPSLWIETRPTEQAHLSFSFAGLAHSHPDRFVLHLLNGVLGEGMRSRLFQEVRERLGLAYSVDSYVSMWQDCGTVGLYAGVAPGSAEKAIRAIVGQLDRLRREPVPDDELERAKQYAKGRLALGLENPFAVAAWYARQTLADEAVLEPEEVMARLDAVQPGDVQRLAQQLFEPARLNLAVVGPFSGEDGRFDEAVLF